MFETVLLLFFVVSGAVPYWILTSKRRAIIDRAKQAGSKLSEEDMKKLEELLRARATVSGAFWLLGTMMLMKVITRLIP